MKADERVSDVVGGSHMIDQSCCRLTPSFQPTPSRAARLVLFYEVYYELVELNTLRDPSVNEMFY